VLSGNITAMRFMHSAREEEQRKKQEREQLRHLEDMHWVQPGFEAEVAAAEDDSQAQAAAASRTAAAGSMAGAPPPPFRIHRRSYKGYNANVEQSMRDQLKKHADLANAAEELEQASRLHAMKQRRVRA